MHITEEMVKELRRRVNISYEEAEKWLKRTNGDINLAERKISQKQDSFWNNLKSGFRNIFNYKFILSKDKTVMIDLPFWTILLLYIFLSMSNLSANFLFFLFIVITLMNGTKIVITDDFESDAVYEKTKTSKEYNKTRTHNNYAKGYDGYYEKEISKKNSARQNRERKHPNAKGDYLDSSKRMKEGSDKDDTSDEYYEIVIED